MSLLRLAVHVAKETNPSTPPCPVFAAEPHPLILVLVLPKGKVQKIQVYMMALKHHTRAMTWRTQVAFLVIKLGSIAGLEVALMKWTTE